MRLTTRLMQIASWLVAASRGQEGECRLPRRTRKKTKVKLTIADPADVHAMDLLPNGCVNSSTVAGRSTTACAGWT